MTVFSKGLSSAVIQPLVKLTSLSNSWGWP